MHVRALLLDLHGTLMEDMDRFGAVQDFAATWRRIGGPPADDAWIDGSVRRLLAVLLERYEDPSWQERFPGVGEVVYERFPDATCAQARALVRVVAEHERGRLPPENASALRRLAACYPLAVITNLLSDKGLWLEAFDEAGIGGCFEAVTASSDTRFLKPSPALFERALAPFMRAGVAAGEVLMVGDDYRRDLRPAMDLGLRTAWIAPSRARAPGPEPDLHLASFVVLAERLLAQRGGHDA